MSRVGGSAIGLAEIQLLAAALLSADREVDALKQNLKEAEARAKALREDSLPMAMIELGLEEFKLSSGEQLSIKEDVQFQMQDANKEQAFQWIEEHGFGGIIKTVVGAQFSKGELAGAVTLFERLREEGLTTSIKRDVHWQTLAAWLREQMLDPARAKDFPAQLFGAVPIWTTKIKAAKSVGTN